jgi:deazaflavin-dependent oxidoreductase (nitroreductase family)
MTSQPTAAQEKDWNAEVIAEFRANGGKVTAPYDNPPPMLLVHTTGRKTGRDHITPMRTLVDDDAMYIFASAHGSTKDPDWYRNILANPEIEIEIGTERRHVRATALQDPERGRIWKKWADAIPALHDTAARAARPIPVVRLDPRD